MWAGPPSPRITASRSAVQPRSFTWSMSMSVSSRRRTVSTWPRSAAGMRASHRTFVRARSGSARSTSSRTSRNPSPVERSRSRGGRPGGRRRRRRRRARGRRPRDAVRGMRAAVPPLASASSGLVPVEQTLDRVDVAGGRRRDERAAEVSCRSCCSCTLRRRGPRAGRAARASCDVSSEVASFGWALVVLDHDRCSSSKACRSMLVRPVEARPGTPRDAPVHRLPSGAMEDDRGGRGAAEDRVGGGGRRHDADARPGRRSSRSASA